MIVYHGTSYGYHNDIMKNGLLPRGNKEGNFWMGI